MTLSPFARTVIRSIRLSADLAAAVESLSRDSGITRQDVIRLSLERGLKILRQQLLPS